MFECMSIDIYCMQETRFRGKSVGAVKGKLGKTK